MKRFTTIFAAATATLAVAILAAGCGGSSGTAASGSSGQNSGGYGYGGNSNGGSSNGGGQSAKPASSAATISVANSSLGRILVDAEGLTLYLFENDTGTTSTCYGACASNWPPVTTTGAPNAGSGADPTKLGTTKRSDGTLQVTYNGHPLYRYAGDSKPGETNGQGVEAFGAEWYVLSPAGNKVEQAGS